MGSKLIILLGLFLAVTLLISSEIATARELAETTTVDPSKEADGPAVNDAKYNKGYGGFVGGNGGGYGGGYGGYCRYGCCGQSYYGGGCQCCSYAGEKVDAEPKN